MGEQVPVDVFLDEAPPCAMFFVEVEHPPQFLRGPFVTFQGGIKKVAPLFPALDEGAAEASLPHF
jgi:hypothetical protein